MWLKHKGVMVNLDNVKYVEVSGRYVVFHFVSDSNPLMLPFENNEQAKSYLQGFYLHTKAIKNGNIDSSEWNLN